MEREAPVSLLPGDGMNWNQRGFSPLKKHPKSETSVQSLFCSESWQRWWHPEPLPREPHSAWHQVPEPWPVSVSIWAQSRIIPLMLARCVCRYHKSLRKVIFGVWESSKMFPCKLMVIGSLFYVIPASEGFHRNTLLLGTRRNLSFELVREELKCTSFVHLYAMLL